MLGVLEGLEIDLSEMCRPDVGPTPTRALGLASLLERDAEFLQE